MNKILFFVLCLIITSVTGYGQNHILILNKSGKTAWQLDAQNGQKVAEYPTREGPHEVAVSPGGTRAAVTNYGADRAGSSISILNLENQTVENVIDLSPYSRPHDLQWFRDGNRLMVTVEAQQAVAIVDITEGEVIKTISTNEEGSHMLKLGPDEKRCYVTNRGPGSLSILDIPEGRIIKTVATGSGSEGIALANGGTEIWVTNRAANTVSIVDSKTLSVTRTLKSGDFPIRAEKSPDGRWVAVSNARSGTVAVFDAKTKNKLHELSTTGRGENGVPIGLVFSDDGSHLYVANSEADQIAVIDTGRWSVTGTFPTGDTPDGIAYLGSK